MPRKHGPLVISLRIFTCLTYVWQDLPNNLGGVGLADPAIGKTFNAKSKMFIVISLLYIVGRTPCLSYWIPLYLGQLHLSSVTIYDAVRLNGTQLSIVYLVTLWRGEVGSLVWVVADLSSSPQPQHTTSL